MDMGTSGLSAGSDRDCLFSFSQRALTWIWEHQALVQVQIETAYSIYGDAAVLIDMDMGTSGLSAGSDRDCLFYGDAAVLRDRVCFVIMSSREVLIMLSTLYQQTDTLSQ